MISDQSATLQLSKVTGDTCHGHTSGVDHPRARAYVHVGGPRHAPGWSAAVHGSDGHRAITLTITAGENCHTRTRSIESGTSPGKFISSREIYFLGINNPTCTYYQDILLRLATPLADIAESFSNGTRPMSCKSAKMKARHIRAL